MATLDASIVNIALPTLSRDLIYPIEKIRWVVISYLLVITCLLLPFGRLSDQFGRKRVFQTGLLTFIAGSALCGAAANLGALVAFRGVQALGAAMLMANGPAIITSCFSARERGGALGVMAMVVSAGLISGPALGGLLIHWLGWRSIFLVNLPIGLIGIGLVQAYLSQDFRQKSPRVSFDWFGTLLQTLILGLFIILLDPPHFSAMGGVDFPVPRWGLLLALGLLLAAFVRVERSLPAPIFDFSLLKNNTFWTANLASFLLFVSFSSITVLMPFFLQSVLKYPAKHAGLFMSVIPITIFVIAPLSGRLSDRVGSRGLSILGAGIGALGLFTLSGAFGRGIDEGSQDIWIVVGLATIGLATGLFQSPNNSAIMGSVPPLKLGVASAFLATVRNLGLVTGAGLATTLFSWRMSVVREFVQAFHFALFVGGIAALGALFASMGKRPKPGSAASHEVPPLEL